MAHLRSMGPQIWFVLVFSGIFRDGSSYLWTPGSDILYLNVLGTHMIVLNSTEAAKEILDKRASLYSDRSVNITQH